MNNFVALLGQHVPQAEVWAYGSRVNGGAHEGSDLDLVLRACKQTKKAPPIIIPPLFCIPW